MRSKYSASAFRGASRQGSGVMKNWSPGRYSGHSALSMNRESLTDRINDLVRNDGWTSAALKEKLTAAVGAGWMLQSAPNAQALGITDEQAQEVADQIEAQYSMIRNDTGFWIDAERGFGMDGILAKAVNHYFTHGEVFGWIGLRDDAPNFKTCIQVIDPMRVSNPNGQMDNKRLRDGVALDDCGAVVGYWIRKSHPGDLHAMGGAKYEWEYFDRETEWGRPIIVHLRNPQWAGMTRDIGDIVTTMVKSKQLDTYDIAELDAAILSARLPVYISTPMDAEMLGNTDEISSQAEMETAYYKENEFNIDGVQLGLLAPGSEIKSVAAAHPNGNHAEFTAAAVRNIGAALGVPYDILTGDAGNYSTLRGNLLRFQKKIIMAQARIVSHWQAPIYRALVEEMIDSGKVVLPNNAPSFDEAPAAWCQAKWIGPGAGWVDPQKEMEAVSMRMSNNLSTLAEESASQGKDWRVVIKQRARERDVMVELGLDPDAGRPEARIQSSMGVPVSDNDAQDAKENEEIAALKMNNVVRGRSIVPQISLS